jgi:fermentation-respiration switch protein FrsA (DUF1100 family)
LVSNEYASIDRLSEIIVPSLVIHAEGDGIVPFEMGQDLYDELKSKKSFWKLNSRGHTSVFFEFGNLYRDQFEKMVMDLPKF